MKCPHCGNELQNGSFVCAVCIGRKPADPPEIAEARRVHDRKLRRNRIIAAAWLLVPSSIALACVLAYAVTVFSYTLPVQSPEVGGLTAYDPAFTGSVRFLRVVLGFIGTISFMAALAGVPLGIWHLAKDEEIPGVRYDERSGKGPASEVPPEIRGWNWGAAGLTWVWGSTRRVWLSLLAFIPGVSVIIMIVMGLYGSDYAWRAKKYESVDDFLRREHAWKPWGIAFFVLHVIGILALR